MLRTWVCVEMLGITVISVLVLSPYMEEIGIREPKANELRLLFPDLGFPVETTFTVLGLMSSWVSEHDVCHELTTSRTPRILI